MVLIDADLTGDIYIPTAFSPDGDGVNDKLYVYGNGLEEIHLMVFNRWGELVFETTDQNQGWDGNLRGKALNPAVFIYVLSATNVEGQKIKLRGNVTLVK